MTGSSNGNPARTPTVVIVGAGMSGVCMGIKLKQAGIESFTIYEKASKIGGTWRENTYPGLVCDVPSRYYSYSFEPNPDWSRLLSPGAEIRNYFERAAQTYGVSPHIEFGRHVTGANYEDGSWRIQLGDGEEVEADFLISCCGVLHHPRFPEIEGLESFEGAAFHSAQWDHDVELRGKRVGVLGTGSTGVQIVCALGGVAGKLTLFQRTAQWIYPTPNLRYRGLGAALMRRFPALSRLSYRGWQAYVERGFGRAVVQPGWQRRYFQTACSLHLMTVRDRELRRKLTPDYSAMCKRLIVSGGFYRAIQKPNVALVDDAIERVEPAGVRTRDGKLHELDVLVLATGFDAHAYLRPLALVGEGGVTLADAWSEGAQAYRSVALPGFPNFFMLMGPHSPFGNQSLVMIAENQADYIMRLISMFRAGEVSAVSPRADVTERLNQEMRDAMPETVWLTGCKSWYLGKNGFPELWPWPPEQHREMLSEPALDELELVSGASRTAG